MDKDNRNLTANQAYTSKSKEIADQIKEVVRIKNFTLSELANKLGISEEELASRLNGLYDFTLSDIADIEELLQEEVIVVPIHWNIYQGIFSTTRKEKTLRKKSYQPFAKDGILKPKLPDAPIDNLLPKQIAEKPRIIASMSGKSISLKNKPNQTPDNDNIKNE